MFKFLKKTKTMENMSFKTLHISIHIKIYLYLFVSIICLSFLSFICNHQQKYFIELDHHIKRLVHLQSQYQG